MNARPWFQLWIAAMMVLAAANPAAGINGTESQYEYSASTILDFTRYLISKKEYFRAYTELRRLESLYPGYIPRKRVYVTHLYLLYNGNRFNDLLQMEIPSELSNNRCIDALFKADARIAGSEYSEAGITLEKCSGAPEDELMVMSFKRIFLGSLMRENYTMARRLVGDMEADSKDLVSAEKYLELVRYSEKNMQNTKKPALAMVCGTVPGMGYIYAGNTSTGVIALIAVSVLGGLTYFSYRTDNKPLAIFFGIGTSFFYAGSIIGGYRESAAYNTWLRTRTGENLIERLELDSDREVLYKRYGIMNDNTHR